MTSLHVTFLSHFYIIDDFLSAEKYATVFLEIFVLKLFVYQTFVWKIFCRLRWFNSRSITYYVYWKYFVSLILIVLGDYKILLTKISWFTVFQTYDIAAPSLHLEFCLVLWRWECVRKTRYHLPLPVISWADSWCACAGLPEHDCVILLVHTNYCGL